MEAAQIQIQTLFHHPTCHFWVVCTWLNSCLLKIKVSTKGVPCNISSCLFSWVLTWTLRSSSPLLKVPKGSHEKSGAAALCFYGPVFCGNTFLTWLFIWNIFMSITVTVLLHYVFLYLVINVFIVFLCTMYSVSFILIVPFLSDPVFPFELHLLSYTNKFINIKKGYFFCLGSLLIFLCSHGFNFNCLLDTTEHKDFWIPQFYLCRQRDFSVLVSHLKLKT